MIRIKAIILQYEVKENHKDKKNMTPKRKRESLTSKIQVSKQNKIRYIKISFVRAKPSLWTYMKMNRQTNDHIAFVHASKVYGRMLKTKINKND